MAEGTEVQRVRAKLEGLYRDAEASYLEKNAAALLAMVTPDFVQVMPDGQQLPLAVVAPGLQAWFATTDEVVGYQVSLADVAVAGAEARLRVREVADTRFTAPDGRTMTRHQENHAQVTWRHDSAGWLMSRVQYLDGTMKEQPA